MRTASGGALVGLVASALLDGRVALVFVLVSTSLLSGGALMLCGPGEGGAGVGFEELVLHCLQVGEQRGHTLVDG